MKCWRWQKLEKALTLATLLTPNSFGARAPSWRKWATTSKSSQVSARCSAIDRAALTSGEFRLTREITSPSHRLASIVVRVMRENIEGCRKVSREAKERTDMSTCPRSNPGLFCYVAEQGQVARTLA